MSHDKVRECVGGMRRIYQHDDRAIRARKSSTVRRKQNRVEKKLPSRLLTSFVMKTIALD